MSQQPNSQSLAISLRELLPPDSVDSDEAAQLLADFVAISPPRTAYELDKLVVHTHETKEQCFAQCTLELQNALVNGMRTDIGKRQLQRKIERFEAIGNGREFDESAYKRANALDKAALAKLDLLIVSLASVGNDYQIEYLSRIRKELGSFTREQIDAADPERWRLRMLRRASQDVTANGRVSVGNQEALRLIGEPVPFSRDHITETERRFLEVGHVKILVAVPTLIDKEKIKTEGLRCLDGWSVPGTMQMRPFVITDRPTADAYNEAAMVAIEDGADFLLCVEDDHVIPAGTLEKLWSVYQQHGPRAIVGAWYPQKKEPRTGAAIVLRRGIHGMERGYCDPAPDDQLLYRNGRGEDVGRPVEVYAVPQGFTLIPTAVFREIPQPWFATTGCITQDSFFSQLAREAGWKLLVDTSAKIKHVCRETGKVYE